MPLIDLGDLAPIVKWIGGLFSLFGVVTMFGWFFTLVKLQKFLTSWEILLNKRSADLEKIAKDMSALASQTTTEETK